MATQIELIVNKAKSLLGSMDYIDEKGYTYCQRFVRHCYEAAGIKDSSGNPSSATEAWYKYGISTSKDNIPVGAAVYFKSNTADGHVAVYIGGGDIIHVWTGGKVCQTSINKPSGFRGWGWQGMKKDSGEKPKGAGSSDSSESSGDSSQSGSVDLCSTSIVSTVNTGADILKRQYVNIERGKGRYELHIINNGIDYVPIVLDSVEWTTEWEESAGKLSFTILKDDSLNITEGNVVIFKAEEFNVFYGYLFEKSKGKDDKIKCTAYDQIRYFKNKDTYCYKNKKYSEVLKMIADDYGLVCSSSIEDTEFVIEQRVEDDESILDILKNARELTQNATGKKYIMFDDFGSLTIRDSEKLTTNIIVDERSAEDFEYKTSIDDEVYNKIQIYRDDDTTGNREMYIYEDGTTINAWGILQKTVKAEEGENPALTGPEMLDTYNKKSTGLSIKGCFGNANLRGGSYVYVSIDVGDIVYDKTRFFVTKASHKFGKEYVCDLDVEI